MAPKAIAIQITVSQLLAATMQLRAASGFHTSVQDSNGLDDYGFFESAERSNRVDEVWERGRKR